MILILWFPIVAMGDSYYQPLAPIAGYVKAEAITEKTFSNYLDSMFKLGIALCTGLAVLMIIIGGIQYVSSDAWGRKSEGKERILAALLGLVIALGSYALLKTINPDLLGTKLALKGIDLEGIETDTPPDDKKDPDKPPTDDDKNEEDEDEEEKKDKEEKKEEEEDKKEDEPQPPSDPQSQAARLDKMQLELAEQERIMISTTVSNIDGTETITVNPTNSPYDVSTITKIMSAADRNGFKGGYATHDQFEYNRLKNGGVPASYLQLLSPDVKTEKGIYLFTKN